MGRVLAGIAAAAVVAGTPLHTPTTGFLTRAGAQLFDGDTPFRFAGANLYWLGLDENVGGVHPPTPFRIADGLATAAGMGARVVRAHTVGVSTGGPQSFEPALGVFNASALDAADFAIFEAERLGLRLLVPLTDNYHYYHGGKHDFTDWFGIPEADFYTDAHAIAAFKAYIAARLAHVNPYTGRAARDEPAIAIWETGNELSGATAAWTEEIAAYIKSIDTNHLVLDGHFGVDATHATPSVDILSDHYYPIDAARLAGAAARAAAAGRVFIAGEYEWTTGPVAAFLAGAAANANVSGTAFWSLFPHADGGGFVAHSDSFTVNYDPLRADAMAAFLGTFAAHAGAMDGGPGAPPVSPPAPGAPAVLAASAGVLAWRGAALAAAYDARVSPLNAGGPWAPLAVGAACAGAAPCLRDDESPAPYNATAAPAGAWVMLASVGVGGATGAWSAPFQVT
jgi:mannan endo-1,4-beta-mannosidase